MRYCAIWVCSSVKYPLPVLFGKLGRVQNPATPTIMLTIPTSKSDCIQHGAVRVYSPSKRKNHLQEVRPARPSMLVRIAAASNPEKTLEMIFPACQIAIRNGASSLVYHEEVMSATPGTNGPSVNPTRNLQSMKPQGRVMRGMHIVTVDQPNIIIGMIRRGWPLAMIIFAGT